MRESQVKRHLNKRVIAIFRDKSTGHKFQRRGVVHVNEHGELVLLSSKDEGSTEIPLLRSQGVQVRFKRIPR